MPKQKSPTPQELYRARKAREEKEKNALLPPGLINHGNTCFMNSVLQGLIATKYLEQLVKFDPVPPVLQSSADVPIASHRSPELANRHGTTGEFELPRTEGLIIGDAFIDVLLRAWEIRNNRQRDIILSPRDILATLGQKYDQYMDFRQQDAHEFLSQLLDAMRMEEIDMIKKGSQMRSNDSGNRPNQRVVENTSSGPMRTSLPDDSDLPPPQDDKPVPFVDMLFGGKLASILVCQTCKRVSHTYEDFNDLSLSIKAEDYVRERKRDRLRQLAKRLRNISASALVVAPPVQRSSSVPTTPMRDSVLDSPDLSENPRRRSIDLVEVPVHSSSHEKLDAVASDTKSTSPLELPATVVTQPNPGAEESTVASDYLGAPLLQEPPGGDIGTGEKAKTTAKERKGKDDSWVKISRRISASVGLSWNSRESSRNSREEKAKNVASTKAATKVQEEEPYSSSTTAVPVLDSEVSDEPSSTKADSDRGPTPLSLVNERLQAQLINMKWSLATTQKFQDSPSMPHLPLITRPSSPSIRSKRHKLRPPKLSAEETAYLRDILADIVPHNPSGPFSFFKQSKDTTTPPSIIQNTFLKVARLGSIEECLRLFTSVEVLDGENMVRCHRCWKIANGVYKPPVERSPHDSDSCTDSDDESSGDVKQASSSLSIHTSESRKSEPGSASAMTLVSGANSNVHPDASDKSHTILHVSPATSITKTPRPPPPALQLNDCATFDDTSLGDSLSQQNTPILSISMTTPQSPRSVGTAKATLSRGSTVSSFVTEVYAATPSSSRTSLSAPFDRHRRDGDRVSDSATESDGISEEESDAVYVFSDISSAASPILSPSASQTHFESAALCVQEAHPKEKSGSTGIPRSKQVLMRPAYKRYLISSPPPILVVHLKRFQQTSKVPLASFASGFKKLDDYISFPEYLDLAPYLAPKKEDYFPTKFSTARGRIRRTEPCMYRLYAVVVHIGNLLGGHYIAYTALPSSDVEQRDLSLEEKHSDDRTPRDWAYISDTVVRLASFDEVMKSKAYICMYERV